MSGRWKAISPSQFPWEQDALDFIQRAMPNREPFRAYSNFEFIADDELVEVTPKNIRMRKRILSKEMRMKQAAKNN